MSVGVLFAIDSTGSMRWVHQELCDNIGAILMQFEDEGVPARFAAVGFRDHPADSSSWIETADFNDEENEVDFLSAWLGSLRAKGGGGNGAESSMAGLLHAAQYFTWPEVRRRVAAVFTDDHPHVPDIGVDSWPHVHELLNANGIQQVHLFVDERHTNGYDELDALGYDVIRHTLIKNNKDALESSIRKFVKISSTGFESEVEIITRDTDDNPFDFDDTDTGVINHEELYDDDANPFDDF